MGVARLRPLAPVRHVQRIRDHRVCRRPGGNRRLTRVRGSPRHRRKEGSVRLTRRSDGYPRPRAGNLAQGRRRSPGPVLVPRNWPGPRPDHGSGGSTASLCHDGSGHLSRLREAAAPADPRGQGPGALQCLSRDSGRPGQIPEVNAAAAKAFADYVLSPDGQRVIGEFGKAQYGRSLFVPAAGKTEHELLAN